MGNHSRELILLFKGTKQIRGNHQRKSIHELLAYLQQLMSINGKMPSLHEEREGKKKQLLLLIHLNSYR